MDTKNIKVRISKLIATSLLFLMMLAILAQGCKEACETEMMTYYEPVFQPKAEVVKDAEYISARVIKNPGKIYFKDDYLFINEIDQGIHVIDNRNRTTPRSVGFIDLPGNKDLAARGDYLYADNYTDLVILDISNKSDIKEVNRVENVFDAYYHYYGSAEMGILVDYVERQEEVEVDCDVRGFNPIDPMPEHFYRTTTTASSDAGGSTGIGGSMARFTIVDQFLYTINDYRLKLFDISINDSPIEGNSIEIGWDIETIFPYEDKLFFGARSGMHIYDNSNPELPVHISTFEHANACDPVVVQGDLAYVTLRDGTECETFTNQLDVVDISNIEEPELLVTHPMINPHGLGIRGECLFIAEGDHGLKVFNASDPMQIGDRLMAHHDDVHALDVIPLDDVLFMIGKNGLHQYNYNCQNTFTYISTISF